MAQRYGGKYSPQKQDTPDFRSAKPSRAGGRVNLLFLAPLPMLWQAFTSGPAHMVQWLVAFGLLIFSAWLTREGVLAHEAYDERKVARRPAIPRKILGSLFIGAGLGTAGFAGFGLIEAVTFAILGAGLHLFAFGPDPIRNKGYDNLDEFQTDRVARAVETAEAHLQAMTEAGLRAQDRQVSARIERFQTQARELLRTVEEDPRDLTSARKFMGVYLKGARDAAEKFADVYSRARTSEAKNDFLKLLSDLQDTFNAKNRHLLTDNRSDLNVEIEVLSERLKQEGIRLERQSVNESES